MDSIVSCPQTCHLNTILFKSLINLYIEIAKFPRPLQLSVSVCGYACLAPLTGCSEDELLRLRSHQTERRSETKPRAKNFQVPLLQKLYLFDYYCNIL